MERHNDSENYKKAYNAKNKTLQITYFTKPQNEVAVVANATKIFEIALTMFIAEQNLTFRSIKPFNIMP